MVKDGLLWAMCPKCNMVFSSDELRGKKCGSCGKIDFKEILFRKKTQTC